ncbi:MAG: SymE family type I addiction module toxin [Sedimenticola sp.]
MANDHSTGKERPVKIPCERQLTVGKLCYEYPPLKDDPPSTSKRSVPVPWLQLKGLWLAAAGFDVKTPVRVRVMQGCLVVTPVDQ